MMYKCYDDWGAQWLWTSGHYWNGWRLNDSPCWPCAWKAGFYWPQGTSYSDMMSNKWIGGFYWSLGTSYSEMISNKWPELTFSGTMQS